jgi:2-keto-4-pentenoate hydratase/2-oxohepta-3-ene-1,7-dioic acid hydratase in catechol pathway
MKLAQYYRGNQVCLGRIEEGALRPLRFPGDLREFVATGAKPELGNLPSIPLEGVQWAPPVSHPSKIIAIGLNYRDHADESKGAVPATQLIFAKFPNSIIGHGRQITWRSDVTRKVDYEAELVVVIGKETRNAAEKDALKSVFGYTCGNDVSARDLQFKDGQWVRGKSLNTFCPLGPWLVTGDELGDPHELSIRCWLNGQLMQDSSTSQMIFRVPTLISFASRHFTLLPGDIIMTGTPAGVGTFRDPPVYLKNGDEVVVEIGGVGRLVNSCLVQ